LAELLSFEFSAQAAEPPWKCAEIKLYAGREIASRWLTVS
jgi:hypothetical protein